MVFKHLPIDENESPDISIINTISEKQFEFFSDLIPKFINDFLNYTQRKDDDDLIFFQKYLNIYIFENLWDNCEKDIYSNIIKCIYQDKENIDKIILYFERVITETKKPSFWNKLIYEFVTNEELGIGDVSINLTSSMVEGEPRAKCEFAVTRHAQLYYDCAHIYLSIRNS